MTGKGRGGTRACIRNTPGLLVGYIFLILLNGRFEVRDKNTRADILNTSKITDHS